MAGMRRCTQSTCWTLSADECFATKIGSEFCKISNSKSQLHGPQLLMVQSSYSQWHHTKLSQKVGFRGNTRNGREAVNWMAGDVCTDVTEQGCLTCSSQVKLSSILPMTQYYVGRRNMVDEQKYVILWGLFDCASSSWNKVKCQLDATR